MSIKYIEVVNWTTYQNRTDVKHSSWFRMEHRLWFHPDWKHLSGEELHVWSTVLAVCSFINKSCFRLDESDLAKTARVAERYVSSALKKLTELHCVRISGEDADAHVTDTVHKRSTTDGRTDGRTELDFERIYSGYPKRRGDQGKKQALKKLPSVIRTQEDFDRLTTAVQNYAAHCVSEKITGTRYVQKFSTFVNGTWDEWISPQSSEKPQGLPMLDFGSDDEGASA